VTEGFQAADVFLSNKIGDLPSDRLAMSLDRPVGLVGYQKRGSEHGTLRTEWSLLVWTRVHRSELRQKQTKLQTCQPETEPGNPEAFNLQMVGLF
jgi:hypothetical protein